MTSLPRNIQSKSPSPNQKTGQVLYGCRCYRIEEITRIVRQEGITVGIIAVPAKASQETAYQLITAGVTGILNFAPIPLKAPAHVYIENMDIAITLETVAFFARSANG